MAYFYEMGEGRGVTFRVCDYSAYLNALNQPKTPVWGEPERLKRGTPAWKVRDTANGLTVLVSYNTVVSVWDGHEVRHLGKWSLTTSRHQRLFEQSF